MKRPLLLLCLLLCLQGIKAQLGQRGGALQGLRTEQGGREGSSSSFPQSQRRSSAGRDSIPSDTIRVEALRLEGRIRKQPLPVLLDTTLNRFNEHEPWMTKSYANTYLGNFGTPYVSNLFSSQPRASQYRFGEYLQGYFHRPEDLLFFRTRTPYSVATHTNGGSRKLAEQTIKFLHTQNISKAWNAGILYDGFSSNGMYENQRTTHSSFSLFSSYESERYNAFGSISLGFHKMQENGGLSDYLFFESDENKDISEAQVMRFAGMKNLVQEFSLFMVQRYRFGRYQFVNETDSVPTFVPTRFTLEHNLQILRTGRTFSAGEIPAEMAKHLPPPQFSTTFTNDKALLRTFRNDFYLAITERPLKKITAGFKAGIVTELDRYNHPVRPDTLYDETDTVVLAIKKSTSLNYTNIGVAGSFYNSSGKQFNFDLNGEIFLTGYKSGNMELNALFYKHFYPEKGKATLHFGAGFINRKPSYFMNGYNSNYFRWDNNFSTSKELSLFGQYSQPSRQFKASVDLWQLNDFAYFDSLALPAQTAKGFQVLAVSAEKGITVGKFGFLFKGTWQHSGHKEVLPLPAFAGYQSGFYDFMLVKNVLQIQLGYELYYFTKFQAYQYQPALGVFHLQNHRPDLGRPLSEIGDYPYVDLFVNAKLKRVRFFVQYEHANALRMPGNKKRAYYTAYHYPEHEAMLKIGLSWSFYD